MSNLSLSIGRVADLLGVCINTLRLWHASGQLVPQHRTAGGHRRYSADAIATLTNKPKMIEKTIAYARVSTHDQKQDLITQKLRLEQECAARGFANTEVIADLGSGMNYKKQGLKRILKLLCKREISRLVVIRQDRLLRFGAELVFELCRACGCEVVIIDPRTTDPKQTIVDDVLAILTVFSARTNGMRSHSNKKALHSV